MNRLTLQELTARILEIRKLIQENRENYQSVFEKVHPNFKYSAVNLVDYLSLRTFDIRVKQGNLSSLGLSSFANAERYVMTNIDNILYHLNRMQGADMAEYPVPGQNPYDFYTTLELLAQNTLKLFGESNNQINNRVMVTLPSNAADDLKFICDLLTSGMDVARINCSHDDEIVWKKMIDLVRKASVITGHQCKIYMDLPGPKIRTEKIKVLKKKKKGEFIRLKIGDRIELIANPEEMDEVTISSSTFQPASALVSASIPSIFDDLRLGDHIWFDDGKIGGIIEQIYNGHAIILITKASPKGTKLKTEKGINLPDTHLALPSLTDEDISYLPFIAQNADIVGYSFVRHPKDINFLFTKLKEMNCQEIGVVLKIETTESFNCLPDLLLTAMEWPNIGVMIARGDLAVELGTERISEVQEQILWICEAALVPVVWATQIFEKLAQEGTATRAEITDASMSVRAECVMLNKGPNIMETIQTLINILRRMETHQSKKRGTLRQLSVAREFFNKSPNRFNQYFS